MADFDINNYAISIQLALEDGDATKALSAFGEDATRVEMEVKNVAQTAVREISTILNTYGVELDKISVAFKEQIKDQEKVNDLATELHDSVEEVNDYGDDREKNLKRQLILYTKIGDTEEKFHKNIKDGLIISDKQIKSVNNIEKAVKAKNIEHLNQNNLMDDGVQLAIGQRDAMDDVGESCGDAVVKTAGMAYGFHMIRGLMRDLADDAEHFVTANYRVYGSQTAMVGATRDLVTEYGVLREEALDAMAVMGNLRVPVNEIRKLTAEAGVLSRVTGVNIKQTAEYAGKLRMFGADAAAVSDHLEYLVSAQRAFGISAQEMQRIIQGTTENLMALQLAFPLDPEAAANYTKLKLEMSGLAKQMGVSSEAAEQFFNTLANDPIARRHLSAHTGIHIRSVQDLGRAYLVAGKQMQAAYDASLAADHNADIAQAVAMNHAKTYLGMSDAAAMLAMKMAVLAKTKGLDPKIPAEYEKLVELARTSLTDAFDEANQTVPRQFALFRDQILSMLGFFQELSAEFLIPVMQVVNGLLGWVGKLFTAFRNFFSWLEQMGPVGYGLAKTIKFILGAFVTLFIAVTAGVPLFSFIMGLFGRMGGMITSAATSIATSITTIARAIGTAFRLILTGIGEGLAALGSAVAGVMIPLLAVGAAFMMAGIGAYFFAKGVMIIANVGWDAVPAMLGLILAIGLLGAVLVLLAYLAMPVIPALLAIGVTLLMVGAAVWLVGAGLMLMVQAMALFLGLLQQLSAGILVDFATGLWDSSMAIMEAGLIMIPAALALGVGAALLLVASAILIVAAIMFVPAAAMIGFAAKIFATGIAALAEAAGNIIPTLAMVTAASFMFPIAGWALALGAETFFIGAMAIGIASIVLGFGLKMLAAGAAVMGEALTTVIQYAGLFIVAGALLAIGALVFAPAAGLFMEVALPFMLGSMMIAAGAYFLQLAGASLSAAGDYLLNAGKKLADSAGMVLYGMAMMIPIGLLSIVAGAALAAGGTRLLLGSVMIGMASYILWNISSILLSAATDLKTSGEFLISFAKAVEEAGPKVTTGAALLRKAAITLSGVGDVLVWAASKIWVGATGLAGASVAITTAGVALVFSAAWFSDGAKALFFASRPLAAAAFNIGNGADRIIDAMARLDNNLHIKGAVSTIEDAVTRINRAVRGLNFGDALDFNVEAISNQIDAYATMLENAAARVEAALLGRALPAIKAARESGIEDIIKSEAITTVQVMDEREGDDDQQAEVIRLLSEQNGLLVRFLEVFSESKTTDAGVAIQDLADAIKEYMVDASQQKSMLSSVLNEWN